MKFLTTPTLINKLHIGGEVAPSHIIIIREIQGKQEGPSDGLVPFCEDIPMTPSRPKLTIDDIPLVIFPIWSLLISL
jgi:hypothetical protein